ncbi:hypothetical protein EDD21DRAFT_438846 [Dissophora ornata]|nr:hypothetical protein EDD21DRAFT_438846 [Dissophora ornata]
MSHRERGMFALAMRDTAFTACISLALLGLSAMPTASDLRENSVQAGVQQPNTSIQDIVAGADADTSRDKTMALSKTSKSIGESQDHQPEEMLVVRSLMPCPTHWSPKFGHGPVCRRSSNSALSSSTVVPSPITWLDFGLGP